MFTSSLKRKPSKSPRFDIFEPTPGAPVFVAPVCRGVGASKARSSRRCHQTQTVHMRAHARASDRGGSSLLAVAAALSGAPDSRRGQEPRDARVNGAQ